MVLHDNEYEIHDQRGIKNVFIHYFFGLFTLSYPSAIDVVIESCCSTITSEYKDFLNVIFTIEEVNATLKEMGPAKAPGTNGVTLGFYKKNWDVVSSDVVQGILDVLNNSASVDEINHTDIVLVPKKKDAYSTTDFRSISLCKVLCKLVAKFLANRLRVVHNSIVS